MRAPEIIETELMEISAIADDIVKFERQGPFGVWKWEKKKSELDATETAALQKARGEIATSKQE